MSQHKEQHPTTSAEWEKKDILHHKETKTGTEAKETKEDGLNGTVIFVVENTTWVTAKKLLTQSKGTGSSSKRDCAHVAHHQVTILNNVGIGDNASEEEENPHVDNTITGLCMSSSQTYKGDMVVNKIHRMDMTLGTSWIGLSVELG